MTLITIITFIAFCIASATLLFLFRHKGNIVLNGTILDTRDENQEIYNYILGGKSEEELSAKLNERLSVLFEWKAISEYVFNLEYKSLTYSKKGSPQKLSFDFRTKNKKAFHVEEGEQLFKTPCYFGYLEVFSPYTGIATLELEDYDTYEEKIILLSINCDPSLIAKYSEK